MSITVKEFGKMPSGEVANLYTLDNGKGFSVEITNYGGIIRAINFNGKDVVLGRDTLEEYFNNNGYFGALVGRHANRIAKAEFELNGKKYTLAKNNGNNNLHGGIKGWDKALWSAKTIDSDEPQLILTHISPDGDEGFPGEVNVCVTYTVTAQNSIKIHYEAQSDQDTVLNMTNHSYFNLNGHNSGTVDNHTLWLNADFYTPNTDECMPTGEVLKVSGTPFDFTSPKAVGADFNSDFEQIKMFGGYDHNFPLNGRGYRKFAELLGDTIKMSAYTDQPGVQIYSGNSIEEGRVCKGGAVYIIHSGICLETQCFPNAMSFSHYPSPILKKGEKYDTTTEYKFEAI